MPVNRNCNFEGEQKALTMRRMTTLQERLKRARLAAGLSQKDVAERSGIAQPTYSILEREPGKGSKHIVAIANALGVNADWLASGRGEMHPTIRVAEGDPQQDAEISALWSGLGPEKKEMMLRMMRAIASQD